MKSPIFAVLAGLPILAFAIGCAHVSSPSGSAAKSATNFNARTLEDPGLKKFMEQHLNRPLESWPLKTPDRRAQRVATAERLAETARLRWVPVAWQVRGGLRSNLLAYATVLRRHELLRILESIFAYGRQLACRAQLADPSLAGPLGHFDCLDRLLRSRD